MKHWEYKTNSSNIYLRYTKRVNDTVENNKMKYFRFYKICSFYLNTQDKWIIVQECIFSIFLDNMTHT